MPNTHYIHDLNPIAFKIGFFVMPWYWLAYFLGYFWVLFFLNYFAKKKISSLSRQIIYLYMTRGFVVMLLASRFTYIILYNLKYFLSDPIRVFYIWEGGMSFHGGLLGIILVTIYYSKKFQLNFFQLTDPLAVCVPFVLGLGRIANFINGELAGRPTLSKIGVVFPKYYDQVPRHPSQLYEAFFEGFLIFFILWFKRSNLLFRGKQSSLFLILYGVFRFFIEYFRLPDKQLGFILFSLSMGQLLCLIMIIVGLLFYPKTHTGSNS